MAAYQSLPAQKGDAPVQELSSDRLGIEQAGHSYLIPVSYNISPDRLRPEIEKLIVVIHGSQRTAPSQVSYLEEAMARIPGAAGKVLVAAPQFLTAPDLSRYKLDGAYPFWDQGGIGWKHGFDSDSTRRHPRQDRISSFSVVDSLIGHCLRACPNVKSIVVMGHSGGGQFVNRYGAINRMENSWGKRIGFSYLVANPSTYLYFSPERYVKNSPTQFAIPSKRSFQECDWYDRYKFGLSDTRGCTYLEEVGVEAVPQQFAARQFYFLLGEKDNNPRDRSMDNFCAAKLQGRTRLERGQIYYRYLQFHFGPSIFDHHHLRVVPKVGHKARSMFLSEAALAAIFGD